MRLPAILVGAAALAGCCHVEATKSPPVMGGDCVEHAIAYNYGWNLFGCLPIVCGNANGESWCPFSFFTDEVRGELLMDRLRERAEKAGLELKDIVCYNDRDVFFDFYYAPVPWIIQYREVNCSATFVRSRTKESGR